MIIATENKSVNGWIEHLRQERQTIALLAEEADLGPERRSDVHLCYGDVPEIVFKGFLVTWRGNIDRLVAYCPIIAQRMLSGSSRAAELRRAFGAITKIAASPEAARRSTDLLWLGGTGDVDRPVPGWVYGLRCVPLAGGWNGQFNSPRPFCPELFKQMARQPQALRWLSRQPKPDSTFFPRTITEDISLPMRVRQVLICLKSGYSEKEAADELGISKHTIHEHVKHLYQHFGVHSRGELLSLFLEAVQKI